MRASGYILLWLGFVAAAYVSVSQLEVADDKWSTIKWAWYAAAMACGVVGIVILRSADKEDQRDEHKTDAEYSVVVQSLETLVTVVGRLCQSQLAPGAVVRAIDDECAEPFSEFAESRQALVKRFGMKVYADVMTEFASAERYVNRSWSAAADGYVDEVASSLNRADGHLQQAQLLLRQAEATG